MKYVQCFIDSRIRNATLIVLLICMSIAWLFDSDY